MKRFLLAPLLFSLLVGCTPKAEEPKESPREIALRTGLALFDTVRPKNSKESWDYNSVFLKYDFGTNKARCFTRLGNAFKEKGNQIDLDKDGGLRFEFRTAYAIDDQFPFANAETDLTNYANLYVIPMSIWERGEVLRFKQYGGAMYEIEIDSLKRTIQSKKDCENSIQDLK